MSQDTLICTTIYSYQGAPIRLLSGITQEDGQYYLLFMETQPVNSALKKDYIIITDSASSGHYDFLFQQSDFQEALSTYNEYLNNSHIDIPSELNRYKMDENMQIAGISDNGQFRYNLDGLTNGNIAILATCLYFKRFISQDQTNKMIEEMARLYEAITI